MSFICSVEELLRADDLDVADLLRIGGRFHRVEMIVRLAPWHDSQLMPASRQVVLVGVAGEIVVGRAVG